MNIIKERNLNFIPKRQRYRVQFRINGYQTSFGDFDASELDDARALRDFVTEFLKPGSTSTPVTEDLLNDYGWAVEKIEEQQARPTVTVSAKPGKSGRPKNALDALTQRVADLETIVAQLKP